MSTPTWRLLVWSPSTSHANQTDGNTKAIYTNSNPGGIIGGFHATLASNGSCKTLTFSGVPTSRTGSTLLSIGKRDIILLEVDENGGSSYTKWFHGVIVDLPPTTARVPGEYVTVGTWFLFSRRVMDTTRIAAVQDVSEYVDDISHLFPDQVSYTKPTATGFNLSEFEMPLVRLDQAIDVLAKSVTGITPGVDRTGAFLFTPATGSHTLDASEVELQELRVAARDLITRVVMPVLSTPVGSNPTFKVGTLLFGAILDTGRYSPRPVNYEYERAEHGTYGDEVARLITGVNPYEEGDAPSSVTPSNFTNASNAYDGDTATYAHNTGSGSSELFLDYAWAEPIVYGAKLLYELSGGSATLRLRHFYQLGAGIVHADEMTVDLPVTGGATREAIILFPLDNDGQHTPALVSGNVILVNGNSTAADQLRVYEASPLVLNTSLLDRIGASIANVPSDSPARVVANTYLTPVPTVTVTGLGGEPLASDVGEWLYSLTPEGGVKSTAVLGRDGVSSDAAMVASIAGNISGSDMDTLRLYATNQ